MFEGMSKDTIRIIVLSVIGASFLITAIRKYIAKDKERLKRYKMVYVALSRIRTGILAISTAGLVVLYSDLF
jgi:hypothetical protein